MFKTYLDRMNIRDASNEDKALVLASLNPREFSIYVSDTDEYYVYDGYRWFDVANEVYYTSVSNLTIYTNPIDKDITPLKSVSMRKFEFILGSRKLAPVYNFETGNINLIGVDFEDLGGLVKVKDRDAMRVFAYGVKGSEFYFDEL